MKVVIFAMAQQFFGIKIENVNEIIREVAITKLPLMAAHMEGIINLRGRIIPVMNLGRFLDMQQTGNQDDRRIIILEEGSSRLGVVVERVNEVLDVDEASIEVNTQTGLQKGQIVDELIKEGERLVLLINSARLFTVDNLQESA